ncbi:MAG TPA: hypothetical protein VLA83_00220 [Candidatus Binatia bacterium]|nr:hypothetical protein [Candidatus Binatia bacterium]
MATCLQGQTGKSTPTPSPQAAHHGAARVAGIIPAFNAENHIHAPALSSGEKFHLFVKTIKDPYNLVMPALNAVILNAGGSSSGYGSGFSGFAKRYGASMADSMSGNCLRLYAFPSLLHEDPRYFRASPGPIIKRVGHVFGATVWTRKDDESCRFNWSKPLASGTSSALSNTYYPAENRGARLTLSRIGLSYLGEIAMNGVQEFWPDIAHNK